MPHSSQPAMVPSVHLPLLVVILSIGCISAKTVQWTFKTPPAISQKVNGELDDENNPSWNPLRNQCFNRTDVLLPVLEEARRSAPGYVAKVGVSAGQDLFLPPKITKAMSLGYLAAIMARSHADMRRFCGAAGKLIVKSPAVHLALVGRVFRLTRFRRWRLLFVRTALFRLRYQVPCLGLDSESANGFLSVVTAGFVETLPQDLCFSSVACSLVISNNLSRVLRVANSWGLIDPRALVFREVNRPRWISSTEAATARIVQDTAEAARTAQGLFPDICDAVGLMAGGLRWKEWSECRPEPLYHTEWVELWKLDGVLECEFDGRVRRVRPGEGRSSGPGFLGWKVPRRIAVKAVRFWSIILSAPIRAVKREWRKSKRSRDGGLILEPIAGLESSEGAKTEDDTLETHSATAGIRPREPGVLEQRLPSIPSEAPLIRLHNVAVLPSFGSTLTVSYSALAEHSRGDGCHENTSKDIPGRNTPATPVSDAGSAAIESCGSFSSASLPSQSLRSVMIKRNSPRQLLLAADDLRAARRALRHMTFYAGIDLDLSGVLADIAGAVARTGDLRLEAEDIGLVRANLETAGMLGSAVNVPEVVSCPGLGLLARNNLLVTAALKGVAVSDSYLMEHAAPRGGKERLRFVEGLFAAFGHMCLTNGCFLSNPLPGNLLYMHSGQVGLTDLSSVRKLTLAQREGLCRLYLTMAELRGEDSMNPSPTAEKKARLAMEGVGLVIDLPPAGGVVRRSFLAQATEGKTWVEHPATLHDDGVSVDIDAAPHELKAEGGGATDRYQGGDKVEEMVDVHVERKQRVEEVAEVPEEPSSPRELASTRPTRSAWSPLTHVMILRGLFDTQREDALELLGEGGGELLKSMAVRRLPVEMVPVLRMVSNLRSICAHLDVDTSLLATFSRAASKGLTWRLPLTRGRRG